MYLHEVSVSCRQLTADGLQLTAAHPEGVEAGEVLGLGVVVADHNRELRKVGQRPLEVSKDL